MLFGISWFLGGFICVLIIIKIYNGFVRIKDLFICLILGVFGFYLIGAVLLALICLGIYKINIDYNKKIF